MDNSRRNTRLCVASPSFFPVYGGVQLRFLRYLPRMPDRGIDPRIFSGTPTKREMSDHADQLDWLDRKPGYLFPQREVQGVPAYRLRLPDSKGWRRTIVYNQALLNYCRHPEWRPDVLQMLNHLRPRSIPWLLRLRAMGIPLVYAVTIAPTNRSRKPHKRLLWKSSLRRLYNRLDCIVTNNSPLADIVRELGVTTRIEVIPNGIDLERFHPGENSDDRHAIRKSLGIASKDPLICAVGAVIPRKGSDLLLDAWARLLPRYPNTRVIFVGPQTHLEQSKLAGFRHRIEDIVNASGAPDQIHFTGTVANPESYLRAADLLVLASEREGMPNSVLEAMATSLPVVMTPYIGISSDIGTPDQHYLLSEPNADALAKKIGDLLANPALRLKLGSQARQRVEATMSLDRSIDRYATLYRQIKN